MENKLTQLITKMNKEFVELELIVFMINSRQRTVHKARGVGPSVPILCAGDLEQLGKNLEDIDKNLKEIFGYLKIILKGIRKE